jgi:ligand-binding sensor domain-containing protein
MGKRHGIARAVITLAVLLASRPCTFALDPALDISQYAHTAWKIREGFTKGKIVSIAQTPDGYLWLGTEFGLLRFDGVRNVPWKPPSDQHLPSNEIHSLLVARDGTLWVGTAKGLASWREGRLTRYPQLDGFYVLRLLEDHEGTIWAGILGFPNGRLCSINNGSVHCDGEDGSLGTLISGLYEDRKGNLWVGGKIGLWRWKPGSVQFFSLPSEIGDISAIGEDDDGSIIVGWRDRIVRLVDGKALPYPPLSSVSDFSALRIFRDRDGALWIATNHGLLHVHRGKTDVFAHPDGLSADWASSLFEDREGNIWVSTLDGLDRFREFSVSTLTTRQGLPSDAVMSVLAAKDGAVWFVADGDLSRWDNGQITVFGERGAGNIKPRENFNRQSPLSIFQDSKGQIWVSSIAGFGHLSEGRLVPVTDMPGGFVRSIVEDTAGTLWIANKDRGLLHLVHGNEVTQIPWTALGHKDFASALAADALGGLWVGFFNGGVSYFKDGQIRSYSTGDGLGEGSVSDIRVDQEGTAWAATQGGLSRLKNGRVATLNSKNGLPCDDVNWAIEDDDHSFWLNTPCGLIRVARSELDALASAVERAATRNGSGNKETPPNVTIHATVFDSSDGVRSLLKFLGFSPVVAKTSDGKLWFLPMDGVSVIDPHHLAFNKLPPPVHVEQVIADRKTYEASSSANGQLHLPPRIRDLQIDYTALSLVAPEKVLFRYKLEGWDRDWQDVGTRRQAFYSNLPPRNYRFRVIACNNSGVWNEAGTFLEFSIAPAYYQTTWFRVLCLAAFLVLLWGIYRLRVQQLRHQFAIGLEARVGERTRIARDLHDTLLQSFQGLMLHFQTGIDLLPGRPAEARKTLEIALDRADHAIAEGRDAVQGLRASTVETNDLASAIRTLGEELRAEGTNQNSALFEMEEARRRTSIRSCGTKSTGLRAKRCATLSGTRGRSESKWKSYTANGGFGCGSGMTERALIRSFLAETGPPDTTACMACASAPKLWVASWRSGVSSILARKWS